MSVLLLLITGCCKNKVNQNGRITQLYFIALFVLSFLRVNIVAFSGSIKASWKLSIDVGNDHASCIILAILLFRLGK